jgi:predicted kinase
VRGHDADANRLLNDYLTMSGDFGALSVLRLYCVYRSVVRAKVARLQQGATPVAESEPGRRLQAHAALAGRYLARAPSAALYITHGVSGSGKSWLAGRIAAARGFVHVRSDYERRRLAGLALHAASHSKVDSGLYATVSTDATYERLAQIATTILRAGHTALIDASFLRARHRSALEAVARECGAHFGIVDCDAPEEVLRERIVARHQAGRDPSEATLEVLDYQLRTRDALSARERARAVSGATLDDGSIATLPGCGRLSAP